MANDKVVPVIIKLLTEQDGSLDAAVNQTRDKLKGLEGQVRDDLTKSITDTTNSAVNAVSRLLSPEKLQIVSERAIQQAISKLNEVNHATDALETEFVKIAGLTEQAFSSKLIKDQNENVIKLNQSAELLYQEYLKLATALTNQKKLAEDLKNSSPTEYVNARAALESAKTLTKGIQAEAELIKKSYKSAFREVTEELTDAAKQRSEEIAKQERLDRANNTLPKSATDSRINTDLQRAELQLIQAKTAATIAQNNEEARRSNILKQQKELQEQILKVKKEEDNKALTSRLNDVQSIESRAIQARQQALQQLANVEAQSAERVRLIKAGAAKSEIDSLRLASEQSRQNANILVQDAKRIETEYNKAFKALVADSVKAGKEIKENINSGGSTSGKSGGLLVNLLSPIANQVSGLVDSALGSLGSKLGIFRTTVGTQIGTSLARGIGEGIKTTPLDSSTITDFFKKLDAPSKQLITNLGTGMVVAAAAAGAAIGGLITVTTQVAGKFEAMSAQLVTSFKDPTLAANRFREAVELASKTPFDVEQVVRAQVTLAARGEKSLQVLKDVTELAAAQNRDLNETAVAVGHAAEGSLRGYESLRNSFGVTTTRLKEFGAIVDSQNKILNTNEYQINRNREALLNLIRTDFGGGVERLSRTLVGMQSNLRDEITKLSASFGNIFLPTMKAGITAATDFLHVIDAIPSSTKTMVAGLLVAVGAVAALTFGLATAGLAVGGVSAAVTGLIAIPAVAEMTILASSLQAVGSAATVAGSAIASITSVLPVIAVSVGAFALAAAYLKNSEENALKAGDEIKEYSKQLADAKRVASGLNAEVVKTFQLPPQFKLDMNDAVHSFQQLKEIINGKGIFAATSDLTAGGFKQEDIKKDLEAKQASIKAQSDYIKGLSELYAVLASESEKGEQAFKRTIKDSGFKHGQEYEFVRQVSVGLSEIVEKGSAASTVLGKFPNLLDTLHSDGAAAAMLVLKNSIGASTTALDKFTSKANELKEFENALSEVDRAYGSLRKSITETAAVSKFALQTRDINLLNNALKEEESLYAGIVGQLRSLFHGGEVSAEAVARYMATNTDSAKALGQAYFTARENIVKLNQAANKIPSEEAHIKIESIDIISQYKQASLEKDNHKEKLLQAEQQLATVKGSFDTWKKVFDQYEAVQEQIKSASSKEAKDSLLIEEEKLRNRLQILVGGAREEIKIKKDVAKEKGEIDRQEIQKVKDQVKDLINSTKQAANGEKSISGGSGLLFALGLDGKEIYPTFSAVKSGLKDSGVEALSAKEKIAVYTEALNKLGTIGGDVNVKALRKDSVELNADLREAKRTLEEGITKANLEKPVENFKKLEQAIRGSIDASDSQAVKFQNILVAEKAVQLDLQNGLINHKDAQKELLNLEKERHQVQQLIVRAVEGQLVELSKLRDKEIADDIKILEVKKLTEQGISNIDQIEAQILGRKKQQIQAEFQTLAQERERELAEGDKLGKSRILVLDKYAARESELVRKAYLDYAKGEEDKYKAFEDRLKKEQAEIDKFKKSRLGGANSPLISLEELAFQSSLPGFGADLYSDKSQPGGGRQGGNGNLGAYNNQNLRGDQPSILTYNQFRSQLEAKNNLKLGKDSQLQSSYSDLKPTVQSVSTITNTVYINGSSTSDRSIIEKAKELTEKALKTKSETGQLFGGPTSGSLSQPSSPSTTDTRVNGGIFGTVVK